MPEIQCGNFDETVTLRELQRLRRHTTRQLFAARKKFFGEGLGETFDNIVDSLKMKHFYQPLDPVEERKDRVTRSNEWLLGIFEAYRWHAHVYHSIVNNMVKAAASTTAQSSTDSEDSYKRKIFLERLKELLFECNESFNEIPRLIMKYWFLDAAAMVQGEVALSATGLSDSDATFRPLEVDSVGDSGDFGTETAQSNTSLLMEPPGINYYPKHAASVLEKGLTSLPDGVSDEDIHQATTVLDAYYLEPSAVPEEHLLRSARA
ncbi:MAG: hypothetical protein M1836_003222 [Candelina mexicana]|nr:MAG: hypothetical protein M1836_003222 [Candelina mexicana]